MFSHFWPCLCGLGHQLETCTGWVNPRGLWVTLFAGQVWEPALLCVRVWVELAAGREQVVLGVGVGQVQVEKSFVWVTEC